MHPVGDQAGGIFFRVQRSHDQVNARPDQRNGVTLLNGVSRLGGRGAIIETAVEATKQEFAVEAWTVPRSLAADRQYRAVLIYTEYERRVLLPQPKEGL
jgi:hypothetical protein